MKTIEHKSVKQVLIFPLAPNSFMNYQQNWKNNILDRNINLDIIRTILLCQGQTMSTLQFLIPSLDQFILLSLFLPFIGYI